MISETDVISGYLWILGRLPDSSEIEFYKQHYSLSNSNDARDFQHLLISSEEFRLRRIFVHQSSRALPIEMDQPRVVFLHVPKCGGTTLHEMLSTQFPPDRICPGRFQSLGDWTRNELSRFELFSGHFDMSDCRNIPGRHVSVVTRLREPKARLLSLYNFYKAHRLGSVPDPRSLLTITHETSAKEFFSHPRVVRHPDIYDAMVGQLTRETIRAHGAEAFPVVRDDDPLVVDPARILERASATIESIGGFGILEFFDASREHLNSRLGLGMAAIEPRQTLRGLIDENDDFSPIEFDPVDRELDFRLDRLTVLDCDLYERSSRLFHRRLDETCARRPARSGRDGELAVYGDDRKHSA